MYMMPLSACLPLLLGLVQQPGSKLVMVVDTRSSATLRPGVPVKQEDLKDDMLIELAYLKWVPGSTVGSAINYILPVHMECDRRTCGLTSVCISLACLGLMKTWGEGK